VKKFAVIAKGGGEELELIINSRNIFYPPIIKGCAVMPPFLLIKTALPF
jgi:hypothetical protein